MATPHSPSATGAAHSAHSNTTRHAVADAAATNNISANVSATNTPAATPPADREILKSFSPEVLAQALAEQLAIAPNDWHRLSSNRAVRAREQAAAALVYMLKDKPEEALPRLSQAIGWLDKTLSAPPCPSHGKKQ